MIKRAGFVQKFVSKIDVAIRSVAAEHRSGGLSDEDDFTSQMLATIRGDLDQWSHNGMRVSVTTTGPHGGTDESVLIGARKTKFRGKYGAEEGKFGADIVIAQSINTPEYTARKGILIQAKILERDKCFRSRDWKKLMDQIKQMSQTTGQSYVWLYGSSGVRSIRSEAIKHLKPRAPGDDRWFPDDLYTTECATFMGEFVKSKYGDYRITATDADVLNRLCAEYQVEHGAFLRIDE